ncbi:histidinol-phosphate transaminase [Hydrogenobaculum acidophilum]
MFSERIKLLKAYKTETTPCTIKLSSNENPFDLEESIKLELLEVIKKIEFNRYPDPHATKLRQTLAKLYDVEPDNIMVCNGSDEAIQYLMLAIGELEEGVLIPKPTFPMYEVIANALGRPIYEVELNEHFQMEKKSLEKAISFKPALAFISNPNNPTGNLFNDDDITFIKEHTFCVIDEAYYDFCGKTYIKDAIKYDKVAVMRTLSKIGLASLRVGALIGTKEFIKEISKLKMPFNVSATSQAMADYILSNHADKIKSQIQTIIEERQRLKEELSKIDGIKVYDSCANFFLIKVKDADFIHKSLIKKGILTRNISYLPKLKNHIRISIGRKEENDALINALKETSL